MELLIREIGQLSMPELIELMRRILDEIQIRAMQDAE